MTPGYITYLCLAFLLMHTTQTMIAMMIINPPMVAPIMVSIGGSCTSDSPKQYKFHTKLHNMSMYCDYIPLLIHTCMQCIVNLCT